MYYTFTTPPASRAADRPTIDDGLVAEARHTLHTALESIPSSATLNRSASQMLFALPMATLCAGTRTRGVPIEKLIIAIKLAWASLAEARLRLGEGAPEVLSGAVSACIEAYYLSETGQRAD
jgi:hypothetical protein